MKNGNKKWTKKRPKKDIYKQVTDSIIKMMEEGEIPWKQQWSIMGLPKNLASGKHYRGFNIWMLIGIGASRGYATPYWMTYRQATKLGGQIKKGEKATMVVFWKFIEVDDEIEGRNKIPLLRYYNVFNVAQAEGIEIPELETITFIPSGKAEEIIAEMPNRPGIVVGGDRASYKYSLDLVSMPPRERFINVDAYYGVLFHELIHSTRHETRTARDTGRNPYGSDKYSFEELVAELGAAFLCCHCGLTNNDQEKSSASYIQGWLTKFKSDPKMLIKAGGQAQRAVEYILNDSGYHRQD